MKWFPKSADHGDIRAFLITHRLPEECQDVIYKDIGQVVIGGFSSEVCSKLSKSISGQKFKDRKMVYCHPFVPVTLEKKSEVSTQGTPQSKPIPSMGTPKSPPRPPVNINLSGRLNNT